MQGSVAKCDFWGKMQKSGLRNQYLRQLRKAEGGLSGMNTAQAGDLIENLRQ
jgi:hypothetical protein